MKFQTFQNIYKKIKEDKSILLKLKHDKKANYEDIQNFEKTYYIRLSQRYCDILMNYGGGYFGFTYIYSLDQSSHFFIQKYIDNFLPYYLPISDNGCGDFYVLKINHGICLDDVYFWNHDTQQIEEKAYQDILEYIVDKGFSISRGLSQ